MKPAVTVLISTHGRPALLYNTLLCLSKQTFPNFEVVVIDDGNVKDVQDVCHGFAAFTRCVTRHNRRDVDGFSNPAIPYNMGLKAALGEIIVMQGGEILYAETTGLEKLVDMHVRYAIPELITLATCEKIGEADGAHWPVHHRENRSLLFNFGCAFRKEFVTAVGGFEESYEAWGYEDEDLGLVLRRHGAQPIWLDVLTYHQYHPWVANSRMNIKRDVLHFEKRKAAIAAGALCNVGKEWGIDR